MPLLEHPGRERDAAMSGNTAFSFSSTDGQHSIQRRLRPGMISVKYRKCGKRTLGWPDNCRPQI